ncbi:MAG TPA: MarR family winged helix-turn-helix transcriptional regulator [Ornithinimicrobium sp.]|uniref:MarR family winged helix-turn-helix transcriptional regulator n=1 Tax=Ornithinimicrobium sp. TaxID=1977084 RepID=UPI002B46EB4B|nr:MarR family winged helix-turn-helix transcriptional regulator [Ornithinimicrobium sp.]HKJ12321.1 MarR family winged helix-turn-helix transcriptional regulator [Ornithinimicrobium sp.]
MAEKHSRTRLANESWEALYRAQATLSREFEHSRDYGELLPQDYGVLYALASAGAAGLRITDLMDDALLSQPGLSRLVSRLETRALVTRRSDPSDARATRVVLTGAGHEAQRQAGRRHAQHVRVAMTRALDEEEMRTLRRLSTKLVEAAGACRTDTDPPPP